MIISTALLILFGCLYSDYDLSYAAEKGEVYPTEEKSSSIPIIAQFEEYGELRVVNRTQYQVEVFIDGWNKGTVLPWGTKRISLRGDRYYKFYASEYHKGEVRWGESEIYIPKGGYYTMTLTE